MNIPEGAVTVTAEAGDLKSAILGAAQQLGLMPAQVDYKLDMSHFRSAAGVSLARSTVRIVAWNSGREVRSEEPSRRPKASEPKASEPKETKTPEVAEAIESAPPPTERRAPRKKPQEAAPTPEAEPTDNGARSKPENLRGAEVSATDASSFAQVWFTKLLDLMSVEGTAVGTGSADRVHLLVKAERAGRIVGKRGGTLSAIRQLLKLAIENRFGPMADIDVDVGDDRPREDRDARPERTAAPRERERPRERPEREATDRAGDRNGRPRPPRRDRNERSGGDRRERGGRRDARGSDKGRYPEEKLRALARRAAEKALESGQTITINLELNSFDRRIVHVEIGEMEGVESQSEERSGPDGRIVKYVQIIPQRA